MIVGYPNYIGLSNSTLTFPLQVEGFLTRHTKLVTRMKNLAVESGFVRASAHRSRPGTYKTTRFFLSIFSHTKKISNSTCFAQLSLVALCAHETMDYVLVNCTIV